MSKQTTEIIDIPDEDFIILAKIAHEKNITFNQLINDILREQIKKGTIKLNAELEKTVIDATKDIVTNGVTTETLKKFGYAFTNWCTDYTGEKLCTEIIQDGFDAADKGVVL